MSSLADEMKDGREAMKRKCIAVALANTPDCVRGIKVRRSLSGRAGSDGFMAAPKPFTRKALYIFLHECAHLVLGHCDRRCRKPKHVREFEAEMWAHERMRKAGIPVPRSMTKRARKYVAWKIEQAKRRGAKRIDTRAAGFAAPVLRSVKEMA